MAESSLSAGYDEIRQAIAHYLGLSLTSTDWSVGEIALIALILKRGLRQFYKPPKVFKDQPPHRWSFLSPIESITTVASYTTGTIAIALGATTVNLLTKLTMSGLTTGPTVGATVTQLTSSAAMVVFKVDGEYIYGEVTTGTFVTTAGYTLSGGSMTASLVPTAVTQPAWPDWAATRGPLVVDGTEYTIASRTDDTNIELSSAWTATAVVAETYELRHDGNYDMDEDFGGVDSLFMTFGEGSNNSNVRIVSEAEIRKMRADTTARGTPRFAAVRPKNTTVTDALGQRFEMLFFPIPDEAETIYYNKIVHPDTVDATYAYPLGGMAYGDCIIKSCIAAAEEDAQDKRGSKWESFISALTSAIREDQTAMQGSYLGYNGDNSDNAHNIPEVRKLSGLVTYEES